MTVVTVVVGAAGVLVVGALAGAGVTGTVVVAVVGVTAGTVAVAVEGSCVDSEVTSVTCGVAGGVGTTGLAAGITAAVACTTVGLTGAEFFAIAARR